MSAHCYILYSPVSVCTLLYSVQKLNSASFPFTWKGWTQIVCEFRKKETIHVPPIIFVGWVSVCSGVRTAWPIVMKLGMACVHHRVCCNYNSGLISGILNDSLFRASTDISTYCPGLFMQLTKPHNPAKQLHWNIVPVYLHLGVTAHHSPSRRPSLL